MTCSLNAVGTDATFWLRLENRIERSQGLMCAVIESLRYQKSGAAWRIRPAGSNR